MITPEEADQTAARLRDALHAAADVMQVPPALAPAPVRAGRRVRHLPGWIIPLAAAACVVLVVAASVLAARHFAGTGPAPVPTTSVPYYVTAPGTYQSTLLQVHETTDGKVIATAHVPAPAGWQVTGISAAADNTTFFVSAADFADAARTPWFCPVNRFYRFSITSSGQVTAFEQVGSTVTGLLGQLSVSPDGSRLAVTETCPSAKNPDVNPAVQVLDLATRSVRAWANTATSDTPDKVARTEALSWQAGGRTLFVSYAWQSALAFEQDQALLALDTASPGGSLQKYGHVLWSQSSKCTRCVFGTLVSPDGKTLIASAGRGAGVDQKNHQPFYDQRVLQIALSSGRTTGVLLSTTIWSQMVGGIPVPVLYPDGSGQHWLASVGSQFGWIQDGRLVPLPYSGNQAMIAWLARDEDGADVRCCGLAGGAGEHLVVEGVGGDLGIVRLGNAEVA
jgi:hypothetical protein